MSGPTATDSERNTLADWGHRRSEEQSLQPAADPHAGILAPQRAAGNRAVSQLIGIGANSQLPDVDGVPHVVGDAMKSEDGRSLDTQTRLDLEESFGHELTGVRIHTGQEASLASALLAAQAFTVGQDIFFSNEKGPGDLSLLTHEVAHVVQQDRVAINWTGDQTAVASSEGKQEEEATAAQMAVRSGERSAPLSALAQPTIQRAENPNPSALEDLLKDPDVVKRLEGAARSKRSVSGVLGEELMSAEIQRRLKTGQGVQELLPKGVDPSSVEFVPEHEICGAGGHPWSDGVVVDKEALKKALSEKIQTETGEPPAVDKRTIADTHSILEGKAGAKGAPKLHLESEDMTKMTPAQKKAATKEFRLAKRDARLEAKAEGKKLGKFTKTIEGGQVSQTLERPEEGMPEGERGMIKEVKIRGVAIRLRVSRTETRIVGFGPTGVNLEPGRETLRGLGLNYETLSLPATEAEIKAEANAIKQRMKRSTLPSPIATKVTTAAKPTKPPAKAVPPGGSAVTAAKTPKPASALSPPPSAKAPPQQIVPASRVPQARRVPKLPPSETARAGRGGKGQQKTVPVLGETIGRVPERLAEPPPVTNPPPPFAQPQPLIAPPKADLPKRLGNKPLLSVTPHETATTAEPPSALPPTTLANAPQNPPPQESVAPPSSMAESSAVPHGQGFRPVTVAQLAETSELAVTTPVKPSAPTAAVPVTAPAGHIEAPAEQTTNPARGTTTSPPHPVSTSNRGAARSLARDVGGNMVQAGVGVLTGLIVSYFRNKADQDWITHELRLVGPDIDKRIDSLATQASEIRTHSPAARVFANVTIHLRRQRSFLPDGDVIESAPVVTLLSVGVSAQEINTGETDVQKAEHWYEYAFLHETNMTLSFEL